MVNSRVPSGAPTVRTGLELFVDHPPKWAKGRKLGLLCHQASVDASLRHAKDLVGSAFPGQLACLFSPQHGLYAEKQDNMMESADEVDPRLGVPVHSLYGETREPTSGHLAGIDLLLVDLQDVGCRVYTYIWTLYLIMRACARYGVEVAVLDRPNPIGGVAVEGNLLANDCQSFVGLAPLPMRHGLTLGEMAYFFERCCGLAPGLRVVRMEGWRREMAFSDTGLPWVWPSPNMPTLETAWVYPGQVCLEGTNLSEGRGTTRPFEIFGAPFIDPEAVSREVDRAALPGFFLRPQYFEPTFHKWAGQRCRGFQMHVTDRSAFLPYLTTLAILAAIRRVHGPALAWREPPYEYEFERTPADLIFGDTRIRQAVDAGAGPEGMRGLWEADLAGFQERRRACLLY